MNTQFNIFQLMSQAALAHFYKSLQLNTKNYQRSKSYRKQLKFKKGIAKMTAPYDLQGRTLWNPYRAQLVGTEGGWYASN